MRQGVEVALISFKTCDLLSESEILLSFKLNEWQIKSKSVGHYKSNGMSLKKSYKPINWGITTLVEDLNTNRRVGCCWHGFESGLCKATWTGSNIGTMATNFSYFLIKSDFALFSGRREHHSCWINWWILLNLLIYLIWMELRGLCLIIALKINDPKTLIRVDKNKKNFYNLDPLTKAFLTGAVEVAQVVAHQTTECEISGTFFIF